MTMSAPSTTESAYAGGVLLEWRALREAPEQGTVPPHPNGETVSLTTPAPAPTVGETLDHPPPGHSCQPTSASSAASRRGDAHNRRRPAGGA